MKKLITLIIFSFILIFSACKSGTDHQDQKATSDYETGTFGYDLEFLQQYQNTILLKNGNSMLAVAPDYQGRVMTSSANGMEGMSFGWLNYALIGSGDNAPHFNNYGGEERIWMGPEGGQFSVFFKPGVSFSFDNWQVPAPIDSEPFDLVNSNDTLAVFKRDLNLLNYSNFEFNLRVNRTISLLNENTVSKLIGMSINQDIDWVGYTTENTITNTGEKAWSKETGLLSIWILGQFISSPDNTVIVPFIPGSEEELGQIVNDTYFGKVANDRLAISDSLIFFKADGNQRGKIGLSPSRAKNLLGSYDSAKNVLTLMFYNKPKNHDGYVNSMWELQEQPFGGDVINSYNDGPLDDGSQLGPFFELEASSPAATLKSGRSLTHINTTIHMSGSESSLNELMIKVFGTGIEDIKQALGK
ncbi:MAG: DUF6786 family protein [Bacteroidota bacterium]|nr:DUF6786 family protein [Bacteroidota bacterium]